MTKNNSGAKINLVSEANSLLRVSQSASKINDAKLSQLIKRLEKKPKKTKLNENRLERLRIVQDHGADVAKDAANAPTFSFGGRGDLGRHAAVSSAKKEFHRRLKSA